MNLAIDAGGTHLRAEIWDQNKLIASLYKKTSEVGLCEWLRLILKNHKGIQTIGVSYAGQVKNGLIISSPNINIDEYEIKKIIESEFEVSLKIENDLTCAVLAEADIYKSKNISALYVGTGLGLGAIDSGEVIRGIDNMAAEIGHIPYKDAPFVCGCGRSNCIELFASGSGVKKWIDFYNLKCEAKLEDLKKSENKEIVAMFEDALVHAVGVTITLFNPEVLVLGGGIVKSNPYLKDIITKNVNSYALPQALNSLTLEITSLENAALKGALLLKDYNG